MYADITPLTMPVTNGITISSQNVAHTSSHVTSSMCFYVFMRSKSIDNKLELN